MFILSNRLHGSDISAALQMPIIAIIGAKNDCLLHTGCLQLSCIFRMISNVAIAFDPYQLICLLPAKYKYLHLERCPLVPFFTSLLYDCSGCLRIAQLFCQVLRLFNSEC